MFLDNINCQHLKECDKLTNFLEIDKIVMTNQFSNILNYDLMRANYKQY